MNRYMNRLMYHESILFTQPILKIVKMNRFAVLESQNRLSTSADAVLQTARCQIKFGEPHHTRVTKSTG